MAGTFIAPPKMIHVQHPGRQRRRAIQLAMHHLPGLTNVVHHPEQRADPFEHDILLLSIEQHRRIRQSGIIHFNNLKTQYNNVIHYST